PWNSPHNLKLLPRIPKTYMHPIDYSTIKDGLTHYRVFVGPQASFPNYRDAASRFPDNAIMIAEAADAVPWTKPDELDYAPGKPLPRLGMFKGGCTVACWDAHVEFLREEETSAERLRHRITSR